MHAICSRLAQNRAAAFLGVSLVSLSFTGCTRVRLVLGARTSLAKIPATTMEATLPTGPAIAPGASSGLVVSFTDAANKVWVTEGAGKGKVPWKDLSVTTTLVTFRKGALHMPHDPRLSDGKTGHVEVTAPSHPTLHATLEISPRYDVAYASHYAGASGTSGTSGTNGTDGPSGANGSLDPNNPSPGGDGGNGTNGTDGTDGGNGSDGPDLDVYVTLRPAAAAGLPSLLEAGIVAQGHRERFYLIDPRGGSLSVSSSGGAGGSGGRGGRGGSGGSGGLGSPPGASGLSGLDGHNGFDGTSGGPGSVTVHYDASVQPYLSDIQAPRGAVFRQEHVALLW